jgi:hypothetical protein
MLFWYFRQTVPETKKLFCGLARDKNFSFCPVPETVLKSNTQQLKLSCTIPYFLADQMHPRYRCLWFRIQTSSVQIYRISVFTY